MLVTQPQEPVLRLWSPRSFSLALLVLCRRVWVLDVDLAYRYLASWLLRLFFYVSNAFKQIGNLYRQTITSVL